MRLYWSGPDPRAVEWWLDTPGRLPDAARSAAGRIIRTALALPHARTLALAGECAVIVHGLVDRTTRDVDLFTERNAGEALELCAALRAVLAEDGLRIESAADKTLALWGRAEPRDSSM